MSELKEHPETLQEQWINYTVWMDGLDLATEYRQAVEEGRDISSVKDEIERLIAVPKKHPSWHGVAGGERNAEWYRAAGVLIDHITTLPYHADYPYNEPSDLPGIQTARPNTVPIPAWTGDNTQWLEQLHGGLLGRICGCMLGKPVEGWNRKDIATIASTTDNWPLTDYFAQPTAPDARKFEEGRKSQLRGTIHGMVEDDDTNYTTIGFAVVKQYGANFTPLDMAKYWCNNVPILHTCTAERVAYRNFISYVLPPESATHRNPYREWIGAQIRADYFGYANPGNPERAAEWAWRDASISHVKNGIYGEMWVAAMLAAAYVESDWLTVIRAGLAQIPAECRLHEDVEKIITAYQTGLSYEEAIEIVHAQWDEKNHHDWCHTNSNAQVVALGLLYGEDDYEKTITRAVMPGFDTDCNGATCGSLWGIRHGVSALPTKWTAPIADLIRTGVAGYHEVPVSKLAQDMLTTAQKAAS